MEDRLLSVLLKLLALRDLRPSYRQDYTSAVYKSPSQVLRDEADYIEYRDQVIAEAVTLAQEVRDIKAGKKIWSGEPGIQNEKQTTHQTGVVIVDGINTTTGKVTLR